MISSTINISIHFIELKIRFIYLSIGYFLTLVICYIYAEQFIYFLTKPLLEISVHYSFIFTKIADAFQSSLQISLIFASFFCGFCLLYQLWLFFLPGLFNHEKKIIQQLFVIFSFTLFMSVIFIYNIIIPFFLHFFTSFEIMPTNNLLFIHMEANVIEYLRIIEKFFFLFIVIFQAPLYLIILNICKIITIKTLITQRNLNYVIIFIIATILTPPDVLSQFIIAIPLIINYEIAIYILLYMKHKTLQ